MPPRKTVPGTQLMNPATIQIVSTRERGCQHFCPPATPCRDMTIFGTKWAFLPRPGGPPPASAVTALSKRAGSCGILNAMSTKSSNSPRKVGEEKQEKVRPRSGKRTREELAAALAEAEREIAFLKGSPCREGAGTPDEGSAYDLRERVKELNCLYSISGIVEKHGISLREVLQETVGIIPDAWQYPEITSCRITLEGEVFTTPGFRETRWRQSQRILAHGSVVGSLDVCYLDQRPEKDEGPFLKEERSLINVIAERMGAIVEWKRAEEALHESEVKNRALLSAIPDLIFQVDKAGAVLGVHEGNFTNFAGFLGTLVGKSVFELSDRQGVLPRRMLEQGMIYVNRALSTGRAQVFEQHIVLDGRASDFEVRIVVIREDEVLAMVRDITLRKRLEREILEISGREQRRIGQDLHDSLCQHLAGIGFLSKALERRISSGAEARPDDAREIVGLIDQAITLTRGFARGLNPVRLEADGLMNGLLELAANTERLFGIKCRFVCDEPILFHDNAVAVHLYRIAQEALSNAIKHGKGNSVTITFRRDGNQNILTVKDNGVGFTNTVKYGSGIGINIMNYRASMIGASLSIGDGPDGGTLLTCSFMNDSNAKEGA